MNTKAISDLLFENRERIEELEAVNARFRAALEQINAIENKTDGGDWDEIEEARAIARRALGREEA